ncbi:putative nuclear mRNA splicing factor-associated protein [Glonium stellatum]|uniref:Putative nuclear mRNA splicing factor-associated protein n=1 Tax=Glonium stellatum TaxID=574774 RepID=A0A8E2F4T7_9PEZI|nr:putative nuclear mRNA splicing factor-associated protein [Glonium stellatum]
MADMNRIPFPHLKDDFASDPRVSFSKLDGKWILEDDDGSEWEFDEDLDKWVPSLDEALLQQQREAYAVAGVDETEPAHALKKRKKEHVNGGEDASGSKQKKSRKDEQPKPERKNTAVYVTSLPLNTTVEEVSSVFSRCGVIAEAMETGAPRIKLYTDEQGDFKGDALIVYFRPESVSLAIQMLDDTDFRFGETGPAGKMRVKEADFSYKKQQEAPAKTSAKEKKKLIKNLQKLNNKLADWDDDDPSVLPDTGSKFDKVVILKHMFTLEELVEDPAAILDIKEDIRDECSKLGEVTNVVLFDKEEDGIASIRFGNAEAAKACVRLMAGRHFDGRIVEAYIADGSEKFKKTSEKKKGMFDYDDDEGDEEEKRLDEFGAWLEQDHGDAS